MQKREKREKNSFNIQEASKLYFLDLNYFHIRLNGEK